MTLVKVDKGDYVMTEGERGTDLFFILAGTVHCEYESDNGSKHTLMKYSTGQYFGDVAMFILEKNIVSYIATKVGATSATQTTAPKCELYMLPRYVLLQLAFETKPDGSAHNHGEVRHEMLALANEKLELLSKQINKVNDWAAREAEGEQTEMPRTTSPRNRVLSRVLDATDAEVALAKSKTTLEREQHRH